MASFDFPSSVQLSSLNLDSFNIEHNDNTNQSNVNSSSIMPNDTLQSIDQRIAKLQKEASTNIKTTESSKSVTNFTTTTTTTTTSSAAAAAAYGTKEKDNAVIGQDVDTMSQELLKSINNELQKESISSSSVYRNNINSNINSNEKKSDSFLLQDMEESQLDDIDKQFEAILNESDDINIISKTNTPSPKKSFIDNTPSRNRPSNVTADLPPNSILSEYQASKAKQGLPPRGPASSSYTVQKEYYIPKPDDFSDSGYSLEYSKTSKAPSPNIETEYTSKSLYERPYSAPVYGASQQYESTNLLSISSVLSRSGNLGSVDALATDAKSETYRQLIGVPEEGSSRAVISALRALQEKIARLESEKSSSKNRINSLEHELATEKRRVLEAQELEASNKIAANSAQGPDLRDTSIQYEDPLNVLESLSAANLQDIGTQVSANFGYNDIRGDGTAGTGEPSGGFNWQVNKLHSPQPSRSPKVNFSNSVGPPSTTRNTVDDDPHFLEGIKLSNQLASMKVRVDALESELEQERKSAKTSSPKRSPSPSSAKSAAANQLLNQTSSPYNRQDSIPRNRYDSSPYSFASNKGHTYETDTERASRLRQYQTDAERLKIEMELEKVQRKTRREIRNNNSARQDLEQMYENSKLHRERQQNFNESEYMTQSIVSDINDALKNFKSKPTRSPPRQRSAPSPTRRQQQEGDNDSMGGDQYRELDLPMWKELMEVRGRSRAAARVNSASSKRRAIVPVNNNGEEFASIESRRVMPFVVGKSTGKSYSVTANIQRVFALLKMHNPALCSVCSKRNKSSDSKKRCASPGGRPKSAASSASGRSPLIANDHAHHHDEFKKIGAKKSDDSIVKVLKILEKEFVQLKQKYHSLVNRYEGAADRMSNGKGGDYLSTIKPLGEELREVIKQLELKGDQISILKEIVYGSLGVKERSKTTATATTNRPFSGRKTAKTSQEFNNIDRYQKHTSKSPTFTKKNPNTPGFALPTASFSSKSGSNLLLEAKNNNQQNFNDGEISRTGSLSLLKSSLRVQQALGL